MNEDEQAKLINKGVQIGKEHSAPSPQTVKMFSDLHEKVIILLSKFDKGGVIEHIHKHVEDTNGRVADNVKKIQSLEKDQVQLFTVHGQALTETREVRKEFSKLSDEIKEFRKDIREYNDKQDNEIASLKRYLYMGLGGLAVISYVAQRFL